MDFVLLDPVAFHNSGCASCLYVILKDCIYPGDKREVVTKCTTERTLSQGQNLRFRATDQHLFPCVSTLTKQKAVKHEVNHLLVGEVQP